MTSAGGRANGGVPLGTGSPEEPAHTLPAEPTQITKIDPASAPKGTDKGTASGGAHKQPGNDEPELALEPDLPSDGRDEKGEAMIRDLPKPKTWKEK
ncbi:hypothetical protein [Polaromonas sp.]|uniref:hypothetical protein n=1 Tax=Polaromonas sp. TaxID=1869339 RepID=UPI003264B4B6